MYLIAVHVATHQCHSFDRCLSDQESVKRVAMMKRRSFKNANMSDQDVEDREPIVVNLPFQKIGNWPPDIKLSEAGLDCNLPKRANAQELLMDSGFDGRFSCLTQTRIIPGEPEEGERIEQQPHSEYSRKSSERCVEIVRHPMWQMLG